MACCLTSKTTGRWNKKIPAPNAFLLQMNPSASLTASSVVFNTGSENFGAITAAVTFNDGSANSGTVTGNAAFTGTAINRAAGTISGNAVFSDTSVNAGAVSGDATFSASATNNGIVSGTVTHTGGGGSNDQTEYQAWLAANTGVNSYPGAGAHHGQWAYNSTEYGSQADAQAAAQEADYQAWLAANTGVNQYGGAGSHNGEWYYYTSGPYSRGGAYDTLSNYIGWLQASDGVNQFVTSWGDAVNPAATHYGQWAYNKMKYASQAAAETAYEADYQTWLTANVGVSQYPDKFGGVRGGQWAYNSTEYGSQAAAQAAANDAAALAANLSGFGDGSIGQSGVFYLRGSSDGADWTCQGLFADARSGGPTIAQYQAIPASEFGYGDATFWIDLALSNYSGDVVFNPAQWIEYFKRNASHSYGGIYIFNEGVRYRVTAINANGTPYSGIVQTGVNPYQDEYGHIGEEPIYFPGEGLVTTFVNGRA
jgi:hypothetical protein